MGIKSASTKFMGIRALRGLSMKGEPHRVAFLTPTSTTKSFSLQALDISLPSKVANAHGDVSAAADKVCAVQISASEFDSRGLFGSLLQPEFYLRLVQMINMSRSDMINWSTVYGVISRRSYGLKCYS